ncbi:MAG: DUF4249 domain-containing protein [Massilibacteroides sp.]|nr:DUF4249 domain-containing protein [Massilibacteroides sp.]MDD3061909.1 DUF4249 domain-containing protein [Massilibacteroides sp.]MDD4115692.1 DUF4249 domain-containing protein [Massilibacteroides sp.]MDD4661329.1 DUF4249 domain-containing protein [Massilibacteroides sp.]
MKKTNKVLLLLLIIVGTACTERIDLDLKTGDPALVIYGNITDTLSYQSVSISRSVPYFASQENSAVSGAKVTITTSDNQIWSLYEDEQSKGLYQTEELKAGKPGETYHLRVEYDFDDGGDLELYEATTTMLPPFTMDSVKIKTIEDMGFNVFTVNVYAQEPEGEDFYISKYYVKDTLATKLNYYGLMKDQLIDGQTLNGLMVYYFANMAEIEDYQEDDRKYYTFITSGDEVTIEFCRVEKGFFNFVEQAQDVKYGENPMFGGPPSNIQGNISNGAVGYFTAFSPSQLKAIAP